MVGLPARPRSRTTTSRSPPFASERWTSPSCPVPTHGVLPWLNSKATWAEAEVVFCGMRTQPNARYVSLPTDRTCDIDALEIVLVRRLARVDRGAIVVLLRAAGKRSVTGYFLRVLNALDLPAEADLVSLTRWSRAGRTTREPRSSSSRSRPEWPRTRCHLSWCPSRGFRRRPGIRLHYSTRSCGGPDREDKRGDRRRGTKMASRFRRRPPVGPRTRSVIPFLPPVGR